MRILQSSSLSLQYMNDYRYDPAIKNKIGELSFFLVTLCTYTLQSASSILERWLESMSQATLFAPFNLHKTVRSHCFHRKTAPLICIKEAGSWIDMHEVLAKGYSDCFFTSSRRQGRASKVPTCYPMLQLFLGWLAGLELER